MAGPLADVRGVLAACLFFASPLAAGPQADALYDTLGIARMAEVVRAEGVASASDLEETMFPDRGGAAWGARVAEIYDPERLASDFRDGFVENLSEREAETLLSFFDTPAGAEIVALEIGAREAMSDPDLEAAAVEAWRAMRRRDERRTDLIEAFVDANDLIDSNVAGALNSNLAFLTGLADGGAGDDLSEADIFARVWGQEAEIRADTEDWVMAYAALAYSPLPDETLADYVALSETAAGEALNRALFSTFDRVFEDLSYRLGRAVATILVSEDI